MKRTKPVPVRVGISVNPTIILQHIHNIVDKLVDLPLVCAGDKVGVVVDASELGRQLSFRDFAWSIPLRSIQPHRPTLDILATLAEKRRDSGG